MKTESIILNAERNVTLTAYIQSVGGEFGELTHRPAVLIIPGGGYQVCSDREADPVAFAYLKAGYQAFILRYSLGKQAVWPHPLEDYEEAMAFIDRRAEEWHIEKNRIAAIGFSAGGHLAACAATMAKRRPAAVILGYPVIDGDCARDYLPSAPDVSSAVDAHTCPCFVFATRTDNLVPVRNAIHMIDALCANGIAFESHIYGNGPHGLSTGEDCVSNMKHSSHYPDWVQDSIAWLTEVMGGISSEGLTYPRFGAKVNGNHDDRLNLDCTLGYLLSIPRAKKILDDFKPEIEKSIPTAALEVLTLRERLSYSQVDDSTLRNLESKFAAIDLSDEQI